MATEIDELIVQISADTRQLKSELNKVKGQLDKTFPQGSRSPIAGFATQLKGLIGPLAGVASGMAAISATRGIAQTGSEFEDLRDSLNTVFGSVEAGDKQFERILEFAQTTPFQIETITKAFIALGAAGIEPTREMLQTFADTASTSVQQLEVFETLVRITQRSVSGGLNLEDLNQIMDKGIDVLGILRNELDLGKDDIAKFGATAEGAQIIMDALMKGMNQKFGGAMAAKMDNLSTKASNMEIAFKSLQNVIFEGGLGDALKNLTDRLTNFLNKVAEGMQKSRELAAMQEGLPASVRTALRREATAERTGREVRLRGGQQVLSVEQAIEAERAKLADRRLEIEQALTKSTEGLNNRQIKALQSNQAALREEQAEIDASIQAMDNLTLSRIKLSEAPSPTGDDSGAGGGPSMTQEQVGLLARMKDILEDTVTPAEELAAQFADLEAIQAAGGLGLTEDQLGRIRAFLKGIQSDAALDEMKDKFGVLQSAVDGTVTPLEKLNEQIEKLEAAIREGDADVLAFIFGNRTPEEMQAVIDRLKDNLKDLKTDTEETAASFAETMAPAIASMAHAFTNDFVAALTSGQNALSAFKDFAKSLVNQIIATFLQMAVVNKILNAIFGRFDGFEALPTISLSGAGEGKASGGALGRGKPYLVGERGPEMFVPHTAGTLRNGNDTRSMMGGGRPIVINQNLNFSTGVVPTVRAEVQRMLPQISEVTKSSVLEASRRGGNYRKGLLGA